LGSYRRIRAIFKTTAAVRACFDCAFKIAGDERTKTIVSLNRKARLPPDIPRGKRTTITANRIETLGVVEGYNLREGPYNVIGGAIE